MNLEMIARPVQPASFDYSTLEPSLADEARELAQQVLLHIHRLTSEIIEIGQRLTSMKERLGHGRFGAWVEAEAKLPSRTVQNYMRAAAVFGGKCEIISYLPPSTVYA